MNWLNEQEDLLLRKTDIYAWAMAFRPKREDHENQHDR
jgi:hypothetical protein